MEGPTSSWGSRNRITCLTLQEHDDDDELWPFQVCETESKVLETASFRRLPHSLLSGKTPTPLQSRLHNEKPHFTIIIRLRANIQVRAPSRSPLYNSECRTNLISLIRKDKKFLSPYKAPTPVLWSIQPDKRRVPPAFTPGVKRPGRRADHSPSYNVEAKNESFTMRLESNI